MNIETLLKTKYLTLTTPFLWNGIETEMFEYSTKMYTFPNVLNIEELIESELDTSAGVYKELVDFKGERAYLVFGHGY